MWKLLSRAYQDTKVSLGWSRTAWIISLVVSGGLAVLYYWLGSEDRALNEVWAFLSGCFVFIVAVFIPTFLYHLWLTPYRFLQERLDDLEKHLKDIHSESSGEEWGVKFYDRCARLSFEIAPIKGFDSRTMPDLMTELRLFCADLGQYEIRYPPISERYRVRGDNRIDSDVKLWGKYLLILRTCAQQGDLERAQNIYDELLRSDQELWLRLEETAEALADSE